MRPDGWQVPTWYRVAQAAKYWNVAPWVMDEEGSTFWLDAAEACADIDKHYNETHREN